MTESQLARLLIGQEVMLSVGEPWDFEGPDGPGRLTGTVVEVRGADGGDEQRLVEIAVRPFMAEEGVEIGRLVASQRYAEETSIIEQLAAGERAPANLSYADQVPEEKRLPDVTPKLIGSIGLA